MYNRKTTCKHWFFKPKCLQAVLNQSKSGSRKVHPGARKWVVSLWFTTFFIFSQFRFPRISSAFSHYRWHKFDTPNDTPNSCADGRTRPAHLCFLWHPNQTLFPCLWHTKIFWHTASCVRKKILRSLSPEHFRLRYQLRFESRHGIIIVPELHHL